MKIKFLSLSNLLILILTLLAFWFTVVQIKPFLHYQNQHIGFSASFIFFKSYLHTPGGISNYLAEFISQFFYYNTWGSLFIVAIASLEGLIALFIVNFSKVYKPGLATFEKRQGKLSFSVFAVILLLGVLVMSDYSYPYFITIRLLLAFICTLIFFLINENYPGQSLYGWPLIAGLLFYAASGAALVVFAVSTALIVIPTSAHKSWKYSVPAIFLLSAAAIPYLAYLFVFPLNLVNLYSITEVKPPEILSYSATFPVYMEYLLLPAILLIDLLLKQTTMKAPVSKVKGQATSRVSFYQRTPFILSSQVLIFALVAYSLFVKLDDPLKRKMLYIENYAESEQWDKVLESAEDIQVYDVTVNYQINRAYAHLGLLPEHLFNYPQLLGSKGLFVDNTLMDSKYTMSNSDLYYDLGYMDESLHWAFEAQTLLPNSPRILKRLAIIHIIKKEYSIAQKYLNVLGQNMLYHEWVDRYERYISDPLLADKDPVIAQKRLFSPTGNLFILEPFENLKLLVKTNKQNRMAYDYLLAFCLLDKRLNDFIELVQYHPGYNTKKLPRSWEEALAAFIYKTGTVPPFATIEMVSKECRQRLTAYNGTLAKFNNDKNAAQEVLRENFENTFWYYLFYLGSSSTNSSN